MKEAGAREFFEYMGVVLSQQFFLGLHCAADMLLSVPL